MLTLRRFMQHTFNPLHMYCRLRSVGLTNDFAHKVCLAYERYVYKTILG